MLSKKAHQIHDFIQDYIAKNSLSPTRDEIVAADSVELKAKSAVKGYLKELQEAGLIRVMPGISRGIILVPQDGD